MARLLSQPSTRRLIVHPAVLAGLIFAAYLLIVAAPQKASLAFDVLSYWRLDLADLYRGQVGDLGFFPYSPAAALVLAPFTQLPWIYFLAGWYALLVSALLYLGRRNTLLLLALPPVAIDLYHGNIHLLLAAAIVIGFRYPAAWSVVLLTKVTPGIGLLWFAARREWRELAVALAATAVLAAGSALLLPGQWLAWLAMLGESAGVPPPWPALPIPLWLRLPLAALVVWWGARRDARWSVPVAATLALPALWPGGLALLAACWPLRSNAAVSAVAAGQRSARQEEEASTTEPTRPVPEVSDPVGSGATATSA
jgi:hypothetical protein